MQRSLDIFIDLVPCEWTNPLIPTCLIRLEIVDLPTPQPVQAASGYVAPAVPTPTAEVLSVLFVWGFPGPSG